MKVNMLYDMEVESDKKELEIALLSQPMYQSLKDIKEVFRKVAQYRTFSLEEASIFAELEDKIHTLIQRAGVE